MRRLLAVVAALACGVAFAADYPAPKEGEWVISDFRFHTGDTLPQLRLAYTTVGDPRGEPVIVLHGTGGSARSMLTASWAGELFGPGQPLDAAKYFIVIPDAIGHGKSSKPSDDLRMKFPHYNYDDIVAAHHRLLAEHLGIKHVRMVIGNSMGGMEVWIWAGQHPDFMDIAVPMASLPTEMASRNWMMRRMIIDSIRNDPDWQDGEYTTQPKSPKFASVYYQIAMNGGNFGHFKNAPTRAQADKLIEQRMAAPFTADANDTLYAWESSGDYNPSANLDRIQATVLSINAADDERNPLELGILDREIKRVKNGRVFVIATSEAGIGHGTTGSAKYYVKPLRELLESAPRR